MPREPADSDIVNHFSRPRSPSSRRSSCRARPAREVVLEKRAQGTPGALGLSRPPVPGWRRGGDVSEAPMLCSRPFITLEDGRGFRRLALEQLVEGLGG